MEDSYQKKLREDSYKRDQDIMWQDIQDIMDRTDLNAGEKAELRRQRKIQFMELYESEGE